MGPSCPWTGLANSAEGVVQNGSRGPCDSRMYNAVQTSLFTGDRGSGGGSGPDAISKGMGTVMA